ncbi:UDP-glucose 4-epimerase GalE [Domibacillus sp. DTU_2020_1001157_1_SI_ALB_TIR_016]|uniref:UDP-glucose 4-epimerase GalE n=1 Tax=Domibacillus sp. DTU_2020_1001157_1_SI_ALB_TIR_016 TaxID=3077789 RepID=UPI0028EF8EF7|nr:UDP-glucose 4-epimerase GalE [Domibacillus sp. DTU_2020_1001157_1_SI_ALB_TIR_016]WNS81204.1 UDP-glucose 4-epimerase GalE [Domibacillus sp. DTU_2020_1001157_1_SI_ALB_TIR_016]
MTVLITGGAGYIGSHTCVELIKAGYDIVLIDSFANSSPDVIERISMITGKTVTFYKGDLLDSAFLDKVFSRHSIEAVVHFAGLKAVGESVEKPTSYYYTNLVSTLHLLQVMGKYDVQRLVFSSSATVYGDGNKMPLKENARLQAANPYGRTKLMIEEMLDDHYRAHPNWRFVILRYFNPIGAHPSGLIGEEPAGRPNNLMPYVTQVAAGRLPELNVFGADYPTHDGTGVRDYIHVVDLARGHIQALKKTASTGFHTYNLGTGRGYSVLDVVRTFEKVNGQPVPYQMQSRRAGDTAVCYADAAKAKAELGWEAVKTLEDMCRDAWHWQVCNPNGYRKKQYVQSNG